MLAIITLAFSSQHHARQVVASVFIMVWGCGSRASCSSGSEDRQGRPLRRQAGQVLRIPGFWIFQMIWVWVVSLPVTILNSPNVQQYPQHSFGTGRDIAGVVLFAVGFVMESVSDMQRYRFRARNDKSAVCDKGFFYVSRHPNYFGEILLQFGKLRH